jgi:chromate reductase
VQDADPALQILLVSGSMRDLSTNSATLRTLMAITPAGLKLNLYEGLGELPAFNPDSDKEPLPDAARSLRQAIHESDAVLFSTPKYAGSLPGSFKNLLDWTIGDSHLRSIHGKPVAWVNVSPRFAEGAHEELRKVLGYAAAMIVENACVHIPVTSQMIGIDKTVHDEAVRDDLGATLRVFSSFVEQTR